MAVLEQIRDQAIAIWRVCLRTGRLAFAACFFGMAIAAVAMGEEVSSVSKAPLGVVRVTQSRWPVPIPKLDRNFRVGDRATLVQENESWFIILTETKDGEVKLAAVPSRKGNVKVAWVTPENTLFFGYPVACVEGFLYLSAGEELPVVGENDGAYEVQITKGRSSGSLVLSKSDPALYFIPNPVHGQVAQNPQNTGATPISAIAGMPPRAHSSLPLAQRSGIATPTTPATLSTSLDTNWDLFVVSFLLPDDWAIATNAVSESREIQAVRPGNVYLRKLRVSWILLGARWIIIGVLSFILVVTLGIAVLGKSRLEKKVPEPPQRKVEEFVTEESVPINTPPVPDFSGSLSSMSLGSVMQFLNSDKETGTLTVLTEEHQPIGTVDFLSGEIVNAHMGGTEGVSAVHSLLANVNGHFAFVRSKNPNFPRRITEPTMSLLLEAHRLLDESGSAASKPAKASQSRKQDSLRLRRRGSR